VGGSAGSFPEGFFGGVSRGVFGGVFRGVEQFWGVICMHYANSLLRL